MLYLLKSNDYLKIGYTKCADTLYGRLSSYKTHNPDYKLLFLKEGNTSDEEMIHYKYSKYLSNNTEWFYIPDVKEQYRIILEFIFGVDVDTFEDNRGEIINGVNMIKISNNLPIININYCDSEDKSKHLLVYLDGYVFELYTDNVQVFYTSYLDNGDFYSGIYVNHIILYEYRKSRQMEDPFGHITTDTNSPYLLDVIKPFLIK